MKQFSIYLSGVGGQGIGLLSEPLLRAADYAGHTVKGVDTHGLAQRGGSVVSQIRIGSQVHTPLVSRHQADLLISLERHEALRSLTEFAKEGATLIYYNTVWQPLDVRLGRVAEVSSKSLGDLCRQMGVKCIEVFHPDLEDARMLTQKNKGDPDKWVDVKANLPLLSQKKWFQQTRYGYARGREPVRYVENIRTYYDILVWVTEQQAAEHKPPRDPLQFGSPAL